MARCRVAIATALAEVTKSATGQRLLRPTLHEGQQYVREHILQSSARFICLMIHRRWGKNWLCIADMLEQKDLLLKQDRSRLNPPVVVWFVVPTYTLADELWTDLKRMIPQVAISRIINSKPQEMTLVDGTHIAIRSSEHADTLVSAGVDLLYMIEAARMKEDAWLTVRPTLVSQGRLGRVVFNSTPKGNNWFARLYQKTQEGDPGWAGIRIPAYQADGARHELSPMPANDRMEEERRSYPMRWFAQEYQAEVLTSDGAVFRNVRERVEASPITPLHPLVCGVDLAKHSDYSVFAIFDAAGHMVAIDRMNKASYPVQAERLISLLRDYGVKQCVVESNGPGEPFFDNLLRDIHERRQEFQAQPALIPFATTAQSKRQMIDALVVAFERGVITLLPDEELLNEFEAFEISESKVGNVRFAAPAGGWDDRVMACALAWTEIRAGKRALAGTFPTVKNLSSTARQPAFSMGQSSRRESSLRDL
jgi:hypothetical protein